MSQFRMAFGGDERIELQRGWLKTMVSSLGEQPPKWAVDEATDSLLNELISDADYGRSRELVMEWCENLGGNYVDKDEVMAKLWKLRREYLEWRREA